MDEIVFCFPAESRWGVIIGVKRCFTIPILEVIPEFKPVPDPLEDPLGDWRRLATIDRLASGLSGERGLEVRRAVDAQIEAANRVLNGEATLSRRARA